MFRFREKPAAPKEQPKPTEPTLTAVEMELLLCSAYGCNSRANPQNATITGVLGIGKAWVFFCDEHEAQRKEKLVKYSGAHPKKKEKQ